MFEYLGKFKIISKNNIGSESMDQVVLMTKNPKIENLVQLYF
jgi:hypothetical protein